MSQKSRREFLKNSAAGLFGTTALAAAAPAVHAAKANELPVVGLIGCGGQGQSVTEALRNHGCRVAYVCDPDESRAAKAQARLKAGKKVGDLRRILDDRAVDAVVVAAPDHWHGPATILACAAGKHVYSEKPCSHNIREGRLMIEAARRYNRVVQVGTQSRSTAPIRDVVQMVREGAIGQVLMTKAWNSQRRKNIGHEKPCEPPTGFDYDTWVGPATMRPYQKNCHHYTWHWWYDFGTGDAGNDGIHEMDICRWVLGVDEHPTRCSGYGDKMAFDDDQQFPDTQQVVFQWPGDGKIPHKRAMIYEQRIWTPYTLEGIEDGCAFYGTEGWILFGKRVGWKMFGPRDKLLKEGELFYSIPEHTANFLDGIRNGAKLNADLETGHRSTTLIHLANIVARVGRSVKFDPQSEQIVDDPEANQLARRSYREGHWAVPEGA